MGNLQILERFEQMLNRYRLRTIPSYKSAFLPSLRHCGPRHRLDLQQQDALDLMTTLIRQRTLSEYYQNIIINAIIAGQPKSIYALPRSKKTAQP